MEFTIKETTIPINPPTTPDTIILHGEALLLFVNILNMREEWQDIQKFLPGRDIFFPEENFLPLKNRNGDRLHTYRFPVRNPKMLCIHLFGWNSYGNSKAHFARRLAREGIESVTVDYRGHGKSGGLQGCYYVKDLVEDVEMFYEKLREVYGDMDVIVMGTSLGGALALELVKKYKEIKAVVLMAPAFDIRGVSKFRHIIKASSYLFRMFPIISGDPTHENRTAEAENFTRNDKYLFNRVTRLLTFSSIISDLPCILSSTDSLDIPMLIIHGAKDKTVSNSYVSSLMAKNSNKHKDYWEYKDMMHSIGKDPEIYDIMDRIVTWLQTI